MNLINKKNFQLIISYWWRLQLIEGCWDQIKFSTPKGKINSGEKFKEVFKGLQIYQKEGLQIMEKDSKVENSQNGYQDKEEDRDKPRIY